MVLVGIGHRHHGVILTKKHNTIGLGSEIMVRVQNLKLRATSFILRPSKRALDDLNLVVTMKPRRRLMFRNNFHN